MTTQQRIKYLIIILLGGLISLIGFFYINDRYLEKNRLSVENAIERSEDKLQDELKKINLVIESMGFFYENQSDISQERFERFTTPFMEELYGIMALEWAPKIQDADSLLSKDNLSITQADSANKLVRSKSKRQYYPIQVVNPLKPLEKVLGYDLYSNSSRKSAIDSTVNTKKMALTGPFELVQHNNGIPGIMAVKSVYDEGHGQLKGVVAGVYRMDEFIGKTLTAELKLLEVCIHDDTENNALLYSNIKDEGILDFEKKAVGKTIMAGDRLWNIHFLPKKDYASFPHLLESYIVLLLGLATTFLLTYIVKKRDMYNDRLEARVQLRTAELETSNQLLETSNRLKENLLREVHHRVKNNLQITSSLMNMQKRKLISKEAITALENSQARISAIALTHQKIYQDDDSKAVNLCDYLTDLMAFQKRMYASVDYSIDCPDISIDLDKAVPLALIISELVTNALKHAFAEDAKSKELIITVKNTIEDHITLSVQDNGKGLPEDFEVIKKKGIGFEIVKALCRQISAKLTYESDSANTVFRLEFDNKAQVRSNII